MLVAPKRKIQESLTNACLVAWKNILNVFLNKKNHVAWTYVLKSSIKWLKNQLFIFHPYFSTISKFDTNGALPWWYKSIYITFKNIVVLKLQLKRYFMFWLTFSILRYHILLPYICNNNKPFLLKMNKRYFNVTNHNILLWLFYFNLQFYRNRIYEVVVPKTFPLRKHTNMGQNYYCKNEH